jgi:serine/threonine protein kinase
MLLTGEEVAVKLFSLPSPRAAELDHEASIYGVLECLQGRQIPQLLFSGVTQSAQNRALVTSYQGASIATLQRPLASSVIDAVVSSLDAIHSRNVAHGDVRLPNFVASDNAQARTIDFGRASADAHPAIIRAEKKMLKVLLTDGYSPPLKRRKRD